MIGDRPLSFMFKPPEREVHQIKDRRRLLGIGEEYGPERFHMTVLPLCDARDFHAADLDLLERAIRAANLEPLRVELARLSGNAMVVGKGNASMRAFQQRLVRQLTELGVRLPEYRLSPHLSLTYGERTTRSTSFAPIGWQVERLLLICSIHGEGRHEPVAEWLLTPRQHMLPF